MRAIAQGASERNISVVVDGKGGAKALRAVHAAFYLSPNTLSIGLIGPGTVGRVLLAQIATQIERLRALESGSARTRHRQFEAHAAGGDRAWILSRWAERMAEAGEPLDLEKFINHVQADYVPHTVIIDCTASAEVADQYYVDWLARGIHIVTPNKKANSGTLPYYRSPCRMPKRAAGTHYLYEATVGAGLPVIQTLRDLRETGDDITQIEGIFSGTLAYLFNVFDGSESFSSIVRAAKAQGLHRTGSARRSVGHGRRAQAHHSRPRNGADPGDGGRAGGRLGARRLTRKCSVEEFMARLPEFDAAMAASAGGRAQQESGAALRRPDRCRRQGHRRPDAPRRQARLCEYRADRQCGAFRDAPLLRQSADRAGPGSRT